MKKFLIGVLALVSSISVNSCISKFDYGMSLTEEEQLEVMQGKWKLTRASTMSPVLDKNGESHIQNDLATALVSMEITETTVTMYFDVPVNLFTIEPEISYEWKLAGNSDTFSFPHNVFSIPDVTVASSSDDVNGHVLLKGAGKGVFDFFTKDDRTANRMILSFTDWGETFFYEFERE